MYNGYFKYENGEAPWNTRSCTHPGFPEEDEVDDCRFTFRRTVATARLEAGENDRVIKFTPNTSIAFKGFTHDNVRNPGATGQRARIVSAVYASLKVCGSGEITDPNFPDDEDKEKGHTGPVGWDFDEHEFLYDTESKSWVLKPADDFGTRFHTLQKSCVCNATDDDAVETVRFVSHVLNTGVQFGQAEDNRKAYLKCYLVSDETKCEP